MQTDKTPIKVIIADDHPIFLDGFRAIFKNEPEFQLLSEATNGEELLKKARDLQPDVIITDILMPGIDGIQVTKKLAEEQPGIKIIGLSMIAENSLIADMFEAGAKGYLMKNAHEDEVLTAIKTVHKGDVYYCKETAEKLLNIIAKRDSEGLKKINKPELSEREKDVMKLICQEFSNKQIATILYISKRTVDWYRNKLLEKLDVKNTAGIVTYALKNKMC